LPDTEVFCPQSYNLQPVSRSLPPAKGLYDVLELLQEFATNRPSASVVCNLSYSNLSFEHAKYIAAWLQVPGRNIRLYALDLSFNRIQAPSWAAVAPLLEWLCLYVLHMDFAGNYLPTIIELSLLTQPVFQHVSLGLATEQLTQSAWVNRWIMQARHFRELAYGCETEHPRYAVVSWHVDAEHTCMLQAGCVL